LAALRAARMRRSFFAWSFWIPLVEPFS